MMNENNDVFTMEDEPIASVVQDMRKGSKWLSAFLESYRPPLDGERYLTDGEVLRRLCRVKQLVFGFPLPFLLVPCLADVPCDVRNLRHHLLVGGTFHCYHFHVQSFLFVSATKFGNKQKGL
jgi:hypothetical protein